MNAFMITKLAHKQLRLARELATEENMDVRLVVLQVNQAVLNRVLKELKAQGKREA